MNVLIICTGNTCRSPMAEGYLDSKALPNVKVESRGLSAEGGALSQNALTVMKEKDIDLSDNASMQLEARDLLWADKILYMSPSHFAVLRLYAPENKLFILGDGISDPFGGAVEVYRKCRDEIFSAIDKLIQEDFFTEAVILRGNSSHIKGISQLERECFSTPWSENALKDALEHDTVFFVAQKGEKVVGYIGLNCILDEGYITNIAITEKERKKGIGTALLQRAFSHAKDNSLSFVSLEVRIGNANAIRLYKDLGFEEAGKRKNFYSAPQEDALILTKRF